VALDGLDFELLLDELLLALEAEDALD